MPSHPGKKKMRKVVGKTIKKGSQGNATGGRNKPAKRSKHGKGHGK